MARRTFDRSTSATGNLVDMNTGKLVEKPPIPVICDRIKKYREAAGIEQKELARKLNITANSISNWETGRARPDINLIPGICELLHVTLYELFDMARRKFDGIISGTVTRVDMNTGNLIEKLRNTNI